MTSLSLENRQNPLIHPFRPVCVHCIDPQHGAESAGSLHSLVLKMLQRKTPLSCDRTSDWSSPQKRLYTWRKAARCVKNS